MNLPVTGWVLGISFKLISLRPYNNIIHYPFLWTHLIFLYLGRLNYCFKMTLMLNKCQIIEPKQLFFFNAEIIWSWLENPRWCVLKASILWEFWCVLITNSNTKINTGPYPPLYSISRQNQYLFLYTSICRTWKSIALIKSAPFHTLSLASRWSICCGCSVCNTSYYELFLAVCEWLLHSDLRHTHIYGWVIHLTQPLYQE